MVGKEDATVAYCAKAFILLVVVAACVAGAGRVSAGPRVGVVDGMVINPSAAEAKKAQGGAGGEVIGWGRPMRVALARNEFEPAQVVIEAPPGQSLENVELTLETPRRVGGTETSWPTDGISLWQVGQVEVYNLWSPHQSLGWYPDPLLPLTKAFTVDAGQRRTIWVRFFAPPGLPAGTYRGGLTVSTGGKSLGRVPVEVTVWDFSVPVEQHFALVIPIWGGHMRSMYPDSQTPERRRAYLDMLYDHRVAPIALGDDEIDHAIERGVRDFNLACFPKDHVGDDTAKRVGKAAALWREKGWDQRARSYVLLGDEAPKQHYPNLQAQGKRVAQLAPKAARRFTVHDQMFGQADWIGEQMRGVADTVILGAAHCYPTENLTRSFREAGFDVWWYHVAEHYYIRAGHDMPKGGCRYGGTGSTRFPASSIGE